MDLSPAPSAVEGQPPVTASSVLAPTALAAVRRGVAPGAAWTLLCVGVDGAALALATLAAQLGAESAGADALTFAWSAAFGGVAMLVAASRGLYRRRLVANPLGDLGDLGIALAIAGMSVVTAAVLLGVQASVADAVVRQAAFGLVYVGAARTALSWAVANAHARGDLVRPTLIVGAGRVGRLVARRLLARPQFGLAPVAFLDDDPPLDPGDELELPLAGAVRELDSAVLESGAQHVLIAFTRAADEDLLEIVTRCERLGVTVSIVPRLFEKVPERMDVAHLGGLPLLTPRPVDPRGWQFAVKYALDRVVAAVLLVLLAPVLAAGALAVLASLGRPVFFRQTRVGRDGKPFEILKFRSMKDVEPGDELDPAELIAPGLGPGGVEGVDRRTRVGSLLRGTSIDELPQLINVLRGEMALVGPRPERPEFVERFEREVSRYQERHRCKAGITGWAQVHGLRGRTSIADRAEWDNYYIENFSLALDLKILLLTIPAVFGSFRQAE